MSAYYEMNIDAGADWLGTVEWTNAADQIIPLTGYSARMMLKSTYADTSPLISLTSETGGGLTIREADGAIDITIGNVSTSALATTEETEGVYDLEIVSSAGVVTRLINGPWYATPQATKDVA